MKNKRNAFELPATAMLMAAGVLIAVVIISILFVQFRQANQMSSAVSENLTDTTDDIKNASIMQYDGLEVTGADVVNFYKKHLGDYRSGETGPFTIVIGGTSYTNGASAASLRDSSSASYVKPTSRYKCAVTKNANGVITRVTFTKI